MTAVELIVIIILIGILLACAVGMGINARVLAGRLKDEWENEE